MNNRVLISIFVLASAGSFLRADDADQNSKITTDIVNALVQVGDSKEFIEWQVEGLKHLQKGFAIFVKQAKPHLSIEEQAIVKKILVTFSDLCEGHIEYFAALRLVKDLHHKCEIDQKYREKMRDKWEAFHKTMEIFNKLPSDVQDQQAHALVTQLYAFVERLCIALSVALPVVADELE